MTTSLLEPIKVGDVYLKNRIAMSPMISNLGSPEGYPTDAYIAYLSERAKGGVGLIITEYTYINKLDSRGAVNELGLYSDELTPKFMRLTEMIHALGSKIFVQLVHAGRKTKRDVIWGNTPIAPSPMPLTDEVREMNLNDIRRIKQEFISASIRARRSGFDGVELHGAHGYLLAQFMSPAVNRRNDEYKDGVKLVEEIVQGIKESKMTVGIRLSVTEFDDLGLHPEDVAEIVKRLEKAGIDYVHLSAGRDGPMNSSMPFYYKHLSFLEEIESIRDKIHVPLFIVGSIMNLHDALKAREVADVVVLGRSLLADPYWLKKALTNEPIRPCIRCNQSCRGMVYREVRCDVNPELGWEILPPMERGNGEVEVVGGGAMGMEAARVLAKRGFSVTLYEREDKLGGQFLLFKDPWKINEFNSIVDFYKNELERLGVEIKLRSEVNCDNGKCIYAVPEQRSPEPPELKGKRILIDSTLYAYHDYAFYLAKDNEVYMTEDSLSILDRTRQFLLEENLKEVGVNFVQKATGNFDVIFNERVRDQPTIGKSIQRGYWLGRTFSLR
ncbi:NAD(P)-binding protein [Sulfuracidifex metallicus]|uniref:NAD(P)-binding protein n=1 Tax=Sulfuracidifex metallicus DSM 6482 = JCM 9184 TaxID=523847 RepID=A0A6A9QMA6_SULME|nr:NAD(P)-binding protein [Sulfuracidifex metallicus]MUN28395.1 NAD(P)-binding protein [Sulfuracidifex metallicus DSM 6482 = JCM 9184]WOE51086.1 NAD(P)-binding protein [Sulfuracidifex metallicus DSM 6482 = JCM 9184]